MQRRELAESLELSFPRPFGSYLLMAPLGKGGMGEVYLAKRRTDVGTELCVVKRLRADLTRDREYVTRFIDEARIVVRLTHPNICHVFDVGKTGEGELYMAMEYLAGVDAKALGDRAAEREQDIPVPACLAVGIDILAAVDYAHKRTHPDTGESLQLVHRDISPHNVVIGFDGAAKLIDFGLAQSTLKLEQTAPNVVMGKMAYMGPEQARGDPVDARADQFAVAMVLYELLAGERFYEGLTPNEIWNTVGRGGFRPRKFKLIDKGIARILDKALQKERKRRFPDCAEFRKALVEYQHAHFSEGGQEALSRAMADFMGPELEAEWARMADFHEFSLSGFTQQLEQTGRMAQVIAQAMPHESPLRAHLPQPRPARPDEPTQMVDSRSISGEGFPRHITSSKPNPAAGHTSGPTHESTELLPRRRTLSGGSAAAPGHGVSGPREATELVARSGASSTPAETVVVLHPSEAARPAPPASRPLLFAVGGLAAILLLALGALLAVLVIGDDEQKVATGATGATDATAATAEPGGAHNPIGPTGDTRPTSGSDAPPAEPGREEPADEAATAPDAEEAPAQVPAVQPDDEGSGGRATARPRPSSARPRRSDSSADRADRDRGERERAEKERAEQERADRERLAREAAAERGREKLRDQTRSAIDKGEQAMAGKGYADRTGWPTKVESAWQRAQVDDTDVEKAKAFLKLARAAPKKGKPESEAPSPRPTTVKGRVDALKPCRARQQCAVQLSADYGLNWSNWNDAKKGEFERKLSRCEKACGQ